MITPNDSNAGARPAPAASLPRVSIMIEGDQHADLDLVHTMLKSEFPTLKMALRSAIEMFLREHKPRALAAAKKRLNG